MRSEQLEKFLKFPAEVRNFVVSLDPLSGAEGEGAAPRAHAHEAQGLRRRRPAAQALRKY